MTSCAVVRSTFRLHDSPILTQALNDVNLKCIIVPIDTHRVCKPNQMLPTFAKSIGDEHITDPRFITCHRHYLWGYHQYMFMLRAIRSFINDLTKCLADKRRDSVRIEVWKASSSQMVKALATKYSTCYVDRVDDPAWETFDSTLTKAFAKESKALSFITTQTILDWSEETECQDFLQDWRKRWRIPQSNAEFKAFVVKTLDAREHTSQSLKLVCSSNNVCFKRLLKRAKSQPVVGSKTKGGLVKRTLRRSKSLTTDASPNKTRTNSLHLDVDTEHKRWKIAFEKHGVQEYDLVDGSLENFALRHLEKTVKTMELPSWTKPDTNVSLGIRDHDPNPIKDTSKLSPYFALGILSPRFAFYRWWGPNAKARATNGLAPSSAAGQLLWRETFHAASHLPHWWVRRQCKLTKDQRFWRYELKEGEPYGGWPIWRGSEKDPSYQKWLTATTGMPDLDESLVLLAKQGWIHHLRRHMIL